MFTLKQTTNTDVFSSRVLRCATVCLRQARYILFVNVNTFNCLKSLLCLKRQHLSSFLVTRYLALITISMSFVENKAPLQAMEDRSESTDDEGKGNIIVSNQERIALEILIVQ